jgi:hypothetical protein
MRVWPPVEPHMAGSAVWEPRMGAGANSPTLRYPRQREGTAEIGSLSTHLVNSGSACPMTVAAAASRVIGMDLMSLIVEIRRGWR